MADQIETIPHKQKLTAITEASAHIVRGDTKQRFKFGIKQFGVIFKCFLAIGNAIDRR